MMPSRSLWIEEQMERDPGVWRAWVEALPLDAPLAWWALFNESDAQERYELQQLAGVLTADYVALEDPDLYTARLLWVLHDLTPAYGHNDERDPHSRSARLARLITKTLKHRATQREA